MGSRSPMQRHNFEAEKWRTILKHRDSLPWAVQKMAELIEMQFGMLSQVGPGIGWRCRCSHVKVQFWEVVWPTEKYRKAQEFEGWLKQWAVQKWADLLCAYLDHQHTVLDGLYHCAKVGWNWCNSFDNMKIVIFCTFGSKTPLYDPKIGFLGIWPPNWGVASLQPQKAPPCTEARHLRTFV